MNPAALATVFCSWDASGDISRGKKTSIQTRGLKKLDALALSVPLMISSQLGILNIRTAIELCGACLDYLAGFRSSILAIPSVLRSVRIELHQKEKTVVEQFWPEITNGDDTSKEYEEAVLRFYNNYILFVHDNVTGKLEDATRQTLLAGIYFYLAAALPKILGRPSFTPDNYNREVQAAMLTFCETIYPHWSDALPVDSFAALLAKAQKQCDHIRAQAL
jgi:hypothetical protein